MLHGLQRLQEKIRSDREGGDTSREERPETAKMINPAIRRVGDPERDPGLTDAQHDASRNLGVGANSDRANDARPIGAIGEDEAARVRGEGRWWIITREIWPNAAMPLMTDFGLRLIYVILFISSLSFLGLGVQPPQADWGSMVRENLGALSYGASVIPVLAPALAIATLTVAINLVVDDISAHSGGKLSKRL